MTGLEKSYSVGIPVALKRLPQENDLAVALSRRDSQLTDTSNYMTLFGNRKFTSACLHQYPDLSESEADSIYTAITGEQEGNSYDNLGLFGVIFECAALHLREIGSEIFCRHEVFVTWRKIVHVIGQQPFICAFMAASDSKHHRSREVFDFPINLKTDDFRLRQILAGGVAENHFHLFGSSHAFLCNWVCLMNHIAHRDRDFAKLDTQLNNNAPLMIHGRTLYKDVRRAAAIRYFFWWLLNNNHDEDVIGNGHQKILDSVLFLGGQSLQEKLGIERIRFPNSLDYICNTAALSSPYAITSGENRFLYEVFRALFSGNATVIKYADYFYDYLAIRCRFRSEFIQDNNAVGFVNFKNFQDRKEIFIDYEKFRDYYDAHATMAIGTAKAALGARFVEARISSPGEMGKFRAFVGEILDYSSLKPDAHYKNCKYFDDLRSRCNNKWHKDLCPIDKVSIFFVVSVHKEPERFLVTNSCRIIPCRHERHIKNIVIPRINSLLELREKHPETARHVFGIDACSTEIGCRPEVFAPAFRKARAQCVPKKDFPKKHEDTPMLHITFHAGEDFLDVVDGLRYIDEAVRFLDMRSADRLGHALALGVEPEDYYISKNLTIVMPQHDILDNAAWMYMTLLKYNIHQHDVLFELAETYRKQFMYVYSDSATVSVPRIEMFYDSWLLRGDNPAYYRQIGFLGNDKYFRKLMDNFSFCNRNFESDLWQDDEAEKIRGNSAEARILYHRYHYDTGVREKGEEISEFHASPRYIHAVKLLQKEMQKDIASRGIGIECNLSSNYLIGTFKSYDKHPIFGLNNDGLDSDGDSPLLQVSINTDDQGVFDTDIENEYALITGALMKMTDGDGNSKYKPHNVYKYIDNVRKMGMEQSFKRMGQRLTGRERYEFRE